MTLLALAWLWAGGALTPLSPEVTRDVERLVAAAWHVPVEAVRLSWADLPAEARGAAAVSRLQGMGADGWGAVVLTTASGPLSVRVRAGCPDTVWVAARPLEAGARLCGGDLRAETRIRWGAPVRAQGPRAGLGWDVRRKLAPGEEISWPAVGPPSLVRAGEPVTFTWSRGGVRIALEGVALNSASLGEAVRARMGDRRTLRGVAVAPGTATLNAGGSR